MVLAARPGHRSVPASDSQHRWQMLCLACAECPGLTADDSELHRQGKSYTIDTVAALRASAAANVPCWILGQDAFATLPVWHRWQSLLDYCNLVVVERPGTSQVEPQQVQDLSAAFEVTTFDQTRIGQIYRVGVPMKEVSATDIRARLATGNTVEHLLAAPVYTYIRQHRLYASTEDTI
jgi:nicotinate-nucleotide adenylyltransferase